MNDQNVGFLHPGAMGISVAVSARNSGFKVFWIDQDRSSETRARANQHQLSALDSMAHMAATCGTIISVCPPHAASDVALAVRDSAFKGLYVDVNAISPQRSIEIGELMTAAGMEYVDGGIVGGPAWQPESTWLYLSGRAASKVARIFAKGPLETEVIDDEIGKASAVKMSFAAYTKGTTALLCAIVAAAENQGVRDILEKQWSRNGSDFAEQTRNRIRRVTAKAWRFSGEMNEIADTLEAAGLPAGFHRSAADIYERMAKFKDADNVPGLKEVLASLLKKQGQ